jgi:hypothetical protein
VLIALYLANEFQRILSDFYCIFSTGKLIHANQSTYSVSWTQRETHFFQCSGVRTLRSQNPSGVGGASHAPALCREHFRSISFKASLLIKTSGSVSYHCGFICYLPIDCHALIDHCVIKPAALCAYVPGHDFAQGLAANGFCKLSSSRG